MAERPDSQQHGSGGVRESLATASEGALRLGKQKQGEAGGQGRATSPQTPATNTGGAAGSARG